jgi:hypothetical protein
MSRSNRRASPHPEISSWLLETPVPFADCASKRSANAMSSSWLRHRPEFEGRPKENMSRLT